MNEIAHVPFHLGIKVSLKVTMQVWIFRLDSLHFVPFLHLVPFFFLFLYTTKTLVTMYVVAMSVPMGEKGEPK